jgi:hypothetical protein
MPAAIPQDPLVEVAIPSLEPNVTLFVECGGFLVTAVELISPCNKDRPSSWEASVRRCLAYLRQGVHLLLIDVHRRPSGFSFPDQIATALGFEKPPYPSCPAPCAVTYRGGEPSAGGGRFLAVWLAAFTVGAVLPPVVFPLNVAHSVPVDLEQTYMPAAAGAYLE